MFQLKKRFVFEASHRLPNHSGKCGRLHGHSWVGYLIVEGGTLTWGGSSDGMLIDYGDLSAAIEPLLESCLDHRHLNDILDNPTSENLARWIYDHVKPRLSLLVAVKINETCTTECEYRP